MELSFNLLHPAPGPVLILNKNIIPLSVKPPAADKALEKIAHISGSIIFVDLRMFSCERSIIIRRDNTDGLSLGTGTSGLSFNYLSK